MAAAHLTGQVSLPPGQVPTPTGVTSSPWLSSPFFLQAPVQTVKLLILAQCLCKFSLLVGPVFTCCVAHGDQVCGLKFCPSASFQGPPGGCRAVVILSVQLHYRVEMSPLWPVGPFSFSARGPLSTQEWPLVWIEAGALGWWWVVWPPARTPDTGGSSRSGLRNRLQPTTWRTCGCRLVMLRGEALHLQGEREWPGPVFLNVDHALLNWERLVLEFSGPLCDFHVGYCCKLCVCFSPPWVSLRQRRLCDAGPNWWVVASHLLLDKPWCHQLWLSVCPQWYSQGQSPQSPQSPDLGPQPHVLLLHNGGSKLVVSSVFSGNYCKSGFTEEVFTCGMKRKGSLLWPGYTSWHLFFYFF